ncbi:MAG: hypothetical protein WD036_11635 [Bauldia sp.]
MGKINAAWHRAHPMPKTATLDQRIAWHIAHAQACGCREIAGKLRDQMIARGIDVDAMTATQRRGP